MLDVHVPEHGIHRFRDFFLHLFTITIGLLIALGLEASVEALHQTIIHVTQKHSEPILFSVRQVYEPDRDNPQVQVRCRVL